MVSLRAWCLTQPSKSMFSQSTVEPFFPTLVWIRDLEADLAARINEQYKSLFAELVNAPPNQNTVQTTQDLHRHGEFAELVKAINAAAGDVLEFLEVDQQGFEISGCWANIGAQGSLHVAHHHANNFLSGVYYVNTPPGGNAITFHDPRFQVEQIVPRIKKRNAHNSTAHTVTVHAGQLLMFPAWLTHSVPPNTNPEIRISISFNIIFSQFSERLSPPRWSGTPYKGKISG